MHLVFMQNRRATNVLGAINSCKRDRRIQRSVSTGRTAVLLVRRHAVCVARNMAKRLSGCQGGPGIIQEVVRDEFQPAILWARKWQSRLSAERRFRHKGLGGFQ